MDDHNRKYWQYEYDVSARYIVPLLKAWGRPLAGASVLDVGCGEGGGLCALHDSGGLCAGFDIEHSRVATALALQGERSITFTSGDLYAESVPFSDRRFDLVTLHDVFEHLDHKPAMIERLKNYLKPEGRLLITFPPYLFRLRGSPTAPAGMVRQASVLSPRTVCDLEDTPRPPG